MPKLFGVTLFVSATLLFLVQPMVGKMILPLLGGTPAVWNTCMVFFQALLLAGYFYAHRTTTRLPTPKQVRVHTAVLLVAAGALALGAALVENHSPVPIVKALAPQGSDFPFFGVLLLLGAAIGLPFFTISTTAPLLQKWFSETGHPSAKDPYFLYAASNFGSLLALIGYPFLVEPSLRLVEQAWLWAGGFALLAVMIVVCGRAVVSAPAALAVPKKPTKSGPASAADPEPHWTTQLRWMLLAAVPSSLMLAVTTHVTTDMVSIPLLWVIPLALYLITFIIVFAKSTPKWVHLAATLVTPVLILLVVFTKTAEQVGTIDSSDTPGIMGKIIRGVLSLLPFATFFVVALTCHGELARNRPSSSHLTRFYLIMSLGGVIGGLFNALVAPIVFTFISEYPITLVAACCLLPSISSLTNPDDRPEPQKLTLWDAIAPLIFFAAARFLSAYYPDIREGLAEVVDGVGGAASKRFIDILTTLVVFAIPVMVSYFFVEKPLRFGAVVGAIWIGTFLTLIVNDRKKPEDERTVFTRSFYGAMKIENGLRYKRLIHGSTVHGSQRRDPDEHSATEALWLLGANTPADALGLAMIAEPHLKFPGREPLTYYHRDGPVGAMFESFWDQNDADPRRNTDVACVGLGTGTLSAYGLPKQTMTFFEIDTTVRRLVEEPDHFTYIKRARQQGVNVEFVMGDARLSLEQTDRKWGFMLVDAFSSDSIPAHLLTREAVKLYFDRLTDDGLLALHISNRYMKLEPVVDLIVRDGKYQAVVMHDQVNLGLHQHDVTGRLASSWVLVARKREAFGLLTDDPRWVPLKHEPSVGLWTDDYSPITTALQEGWWGLIGR